MVRGPRCCRPVIISSTMTVVATNRGGPFELTLELDRERVLPGRLVAGRAAGRERIWRRIPGRSGHLARDRDVALRRHDHRRPGSLADRDPDRHGGPAGRADRPVGAADACRRRDARVPVRAAGPRPGAGVVPGDGTEGRLDARGEPRRARLRSCRRNAGPHPAAHGAPARRGRHGRRVRALPGGRGRGRRDPWLDLARSVAVVRRFAVPWPARPARWASRARSRRSASSCGSRPT